MTRTELANIAHDIIEKQFPGKWDDFKRSELSSLIVIYTEALKDGWTPEEALIYFADQVFEAGKDIHKGTCSSKL